MAINCVQLHVETLFYLRRLNVPMIGLKILNLSGTDLGRDPKTIRELFKQMVFHYSVTLEELRLRGCGLYNSSLEIAWLGVQDGLKDNKTRPIDERRLIML
jgi:hypothetical protein